MSDEQLPDQHPDPVPHESNSPAEPPPGEAPPGESTVAERKPSKLAVFIAMPDEDLLGVRFHVEDLALELVLLRGGRATTPTYRDRDDYHRPK